MLSLLAVGILGRPQSSIPRNRSDVLAWLNANGYPFTVGEGRDTEGFIDHAGGRVGVSLIGPQIDGTHKLSGVSALRFEVDVAFLKEIPQDLPVFAPYSVAPAAQEPYFVAHLGRTVTIQAMIEFEEASSPKVLREELDHFWKESAEYVTSRGGELTPAKPKVWAKERFSGNLVLRRADPVSIERLAESWGWTDQASWRYSQNGYGFPIHVSWSNMFLSWPERDERFDNAVYLSILGKTGRKVRIDLSKGMRLNNFRSQVIKIVADFEEKARTAPTGAGAPAQPPRRG